MTTETTERDPRLRCRSEDVEKPGRTHRCKFGMLHDGAHHECVCGRRWARRKPSTR